MYNKLMTDDELDLFFIDTLKNVYADLQECAEYTKKLNTLEYIEINEDYKYSLSLLTELINNCKTIDDLAELDEEIIDEVYEYIASYTDNFIINAYEPQKNKDMEAYQKLEELLDLFLDTDEEDFDSEDEQA